MTAVLESVPSFPGKYTSLYNQFFPFGVVVMMFAALAVGAASALR